MPIPQQFGTVYQVTREQMCELAPDVVQQMMREFVRHCSPSWETVRMEITPSGFNTWSLRLTGQGVNRGER